MREKSLGSYVQKGVIRLQDAAYLCAYLGGQLNWSDARATRALRYRIRNFLVSDEHLAPSLGDGEFALDVLPRVLEEIAGKKLDQNEMAHIKAIMKGPKKRTGVVAHKDAATAEPNALAAYADYSEGDLRELVAVVDKKMSRPAVAVAAANPQVIARTHPVAIRSPRKEIGGDSTGIFRINHHFIAFG